MLSSYRYAISKNKLNNKTFLINNLLIIFFILFVILISIGYQPKYRNIDVLPLSNEIVNNFDYKEYLNSLPQPLEQWVRTIRGISLFFLAWYLYLSFKSLWIARTFYKEQQFIKAYLLFFNFLIIPNLILTFYLVYQKELYGLTNYLKSFFNSDEYYYGTKYQYNWKYWLVFCFFILTIPFIWFALFREQDLSKISDDTGYYGGLWFSSFHYFTVQTNFLCFFTLLVYLIFPRWRLFKNNNILILMSSYITVVCLIFNLLLVPFNTSEYANQPYKIARTVIEHGTNPVLFIASFIIIMTKDKKQVTNYWLLNRYGLVIPAIYGIYATLSPIVCGLSVYGFVTNTNPNLICGGFNGSYLIFLILFAFAFLFSLSNFIYWKINQRINNNY